MRIALAALAAATLFLLGQTCHTGPSKPTVARWSYDAAVTHSPVPPPTQIAALAPEIDIISGAEITHDTPEVTPEPTPPTPTAVVIQTLATPQILKPLIPQVPPILVQASNSALYDAVLAFFPEQPDKAYRTFMCESGGSPTAGTGTNFVGVVQQAVSVWGYPPADIYSQVQVGRKIYDASGNWSPWPVCGLR